jgi:PAS domain S-box-containing protein
MTRSFEQFMVQEAQRTTAAIIVDEVRHEFQSTDFASPKTGADYEVFSKKMRRLSVGKRVERIKVWDRSCTVIWSDTKDIVGMRFPDNNELRDALNGKVIAGISDLKKSENVKEKVFGRLMELYVPIKFVSGNEVQVVFESYTDVDELYQVISAERKQIWVSIILGFIVLYLTLFGIVWQASRRLYRQNREIERSRERFEGLVRSAHDGIIIMDGQGKILMINEAAERIFRIQSKDILGESPGIFLLEEDRQKYIQLLQSFLECQDPSLLINSFEIKALRADGEEFFLEGSLSCVGLKEDTVITAIVRDISEKKALMEQLINSEKFASVSVIASSIGHEINNILAGFVGYSELLRVQNSDKGIMNQCGEIISTQSQRLKLHANNLLALGKPQTPELKPIVISELIDRVTDLLVTSGMFKMCTIIRNYGLGLPKVMADEMLLEQVIRNLEINAIHAMEKQGIMTLSTYLTPDNRNFEFSVSDTGQGIKDNIRHQIFLPFYTTKEKGKGTGLGLYIVKQIIEQHHGYINLESEEGKGTKIIIGIPIS